MIAPIRKPAAPLLVALSFALLLPCSPAGAAPRRALPYSLTHQRHYTSVPVCSLPRPGHGACQSLRVVRRGGARPAFGVRRPGPAAEAPSPGEIGYTPEDLHIAYSLPASSEAAQTIAIVDAYNDPTAEADLKAFDEQFGLPACTEENGCFTQANEKGETGKAKLPFPKTTSELEAAFGSGEEVEEAEAEEAEGWGLEISLDIETAHAICQNCKIALVEGKDSSFESLLNAEQAAATTLKASEISNSWGGAECQLGGGCASEEEATPFEHPRTVITASAGDDGFLNWQQGERYANFPASLPHVVAVGGTRLAIEPGTASYVGEAVWNGSGASGGGCSVAFAAPSWQQAVAGWGEVGCANGRAVSDVSADADPFTGVAVYYSRTESCFTQYGAGALEFVPNWCQIGGTSLSSPLIAATFGLAGGAHGVSYPAATLYENLAAQPAGLHDVTAGSNGECTKKPSFNEATGLSTCSLEEEGKQKGCASHFACIARAGYDGPTGVGTPKGILAFLPGEGASKPPPEEGRPPGSTLSSGPPPTITSTTPVTTPLPAVVLSRLNLTLRALRALAGRRPQLTAVAFSFLLTRGAPVRVSLAKRVRSHRRARWVAIGRPFTVDAVGGSNAGRLRGRGKLRPGAYRLTLTPSGGSPRSTGFTLG
jgi:Subtilase family